MLESIHVVPWEGPLPEPGAPSQFRYVGPQVEAILGYPLAQWYQPGFWEQHLHPEDRDTTMRLCHDRSHQGIDHALEYRMLAADGRTVWLLDAVRVVDVPGQPRFLRGQLLDITRRKLAEESLRQTQEWLTLAISSANTLCYRIDLRSGEAMTSSDVDAFFGAPAGTFRLHRDNLLLPIHPDDRTRVAAEIDRALADGPTPPSEFRGAWPAADGGTSWYQGVGQIHCDSEGRSHWLVGVMYNITARKRDEEARKLIEVQMHQAQQLESLGVLAGGIAHEFNNLLTTIQGYTDLALSNVNLGLTRDYLGQVLSASRRAAELTQQILAYAGKSRFVLRPTSLSGLVAEMPPLFAAIVPRKARLRCVTDPTPTIDADPSQLRQVILNLVTNAAEALGESEGEITIRTGEVTREDPPGRFALLAVTDTGHGMDEATLARIFEPFFTTKFTGRGLGLASVQGIVNGHRGSIQVSSVPHKGSTFRVLLPARSVAEEQALANPSGTGRILVVDDEPGVKTLVATILTQAGYEVVVAGDGVEGLASFRASLQQFAACVLDLNMPHLDGLELLGEFRKTSPDVPVVLMTGYCATAAGRREGVPEPNVLLQKPFTSSALLDAVRRAVASRRQP